MARIRACGECWKPVAECICDDEAAGAEDRSDEDRVPESASTGPPPGPYRGEVVQDEPTTCWFG